MAENDYTISSVIKSLKTLKAFDNEHREMTLTELSSRLGINKSSMIRILTSLREEGFVKYDQDTRKYSLGIALFNLCNSAYEFLDVQKVCAPLLKEAAAQSKLMIHLAVIEEDEIVIVDKIWPTEHLDMIALVSRVGASVPLHCTGTGKVLAAFTNAAQRDRLIEKCEFESYTDQTISAPEQFLKELEKVRRNGYATNNCEHEPYLCCITRPIFDAAGDPVAAFSFSGLREVMTAEKVEEVQALSQKTAESLSREFGYRGRVR